MKLNCEVCKRRMYKRADAKWCSTRCRSKSRAEDAKFETPEIPKSGVPGVTYNRSIQRWVVKDTSINKYLGSFKLLQDAIKFLGEYNGN
jgi:hypothetical protein